MIPVDENGQNNNNKTQFGMNLNDTFNFLSLKIDRQHI